MLNTNKNTPVNYNQEPFYLVRVGKKTNVYGPYPEGSVDLDEFENLKQIKYTEKELMIPLEDGSIEFISMRNSKVYMIPVSIAPELTEDQVQEFGGQIELQINSNENLEMVYMVRSEDYDEFPILAITQPTKLKSVKIVKNEDNAPMLAIKAEKIDHYRSIHNLVLEFRETLF